MTRASTRVSPDDLAELLPELARPETWDAIRAMEAGMDPRVRRDLCERLDRLGEPLRRPIPASTDDQ